jgi:hypothetical protein
MSLGRVLSAAALRQLPRAGVRATLSDPGGSTALSCCTAPS